MLNIVVGLLIFIFVFSLLIFLSSDGYSIITGPVILLFILSI